MVCWCDDCYVVEYMVFFCFFFFKQKTAYEMRISDWSSDVCSSDLAWTKRFQIGNAAMSGLIAASFAREGYIGAAEAIEGKYGFLHAYASKPQPETAVAGLGTDWETMGIAVKPYPACRMTHAPADAAIELLRKHDIDPAKIAEIDIGLSRKGIDLTADPQDAKRNPQGVVDGQFSMHFVAAVVLREGRMGRSEEHTSELQ